MNNDYAPLVISHLKPRRYVPPPTTTYPHPPTHPEEKWRTSPYIGEAEDILCVYRGRIYIAEDREAARCEEGEDYNLKHNKRYWHIENLTKYYNLKISMDHGTKWD